MKINIKYLCIDFFILGVLFQDQLIKVTNINYLTYLDEIMIIGLISLSMYNIVSRRIINKITLKLFILTVLFSFIGILSCYLNSRFIVDHVILANFLSVKFLLLVIALTCINVKDDTIRFLIHRLKIIANIAIIFAIINIILPQLYLKICPWGFIDKRNGIISPCSIFEHPGTYGWYMLVIASYYYAKYLTDKTKKNIYNFIFYTFFGLLSMKAKVILTIPVILVLGNIILKGKKSKQRFLKKSFLSLFIIGVIGLLFGDYLIYTYKMYYTFDLHKTARAAFNIYSLQISKLYFPLGVGFGKFASYYAGLHYSEYYYKFGMDTVYGLNPNNLFFETDTYWPSILGETGIFGMVIICSCFYIIFKILKLNIKLSIKQSKSCLLSLWGILIFFQALVESLGAPTFNSAPQNIIIATVVGVAIVKEFRSEREYK